MYSINEQKKLFTGSHSAGFLKLNIQVSTLAARSSIRDPIKNYAPEESPHHLLYTVKVSSNLHVLNLHRQASEAVLHFSWRGAPIPRSRIAENSSLDDFVIQQWA